MAPPEIVQPDWTNAPIEIILFKKILLLYWNNFNEKKSQDISPKIVQQYYTIISGNRSGPVCKYINDQVVFTVAAIPRNEELPKSRVYQVIQELEGLGIVEKTPFKAVNPDPSYSGPKARFFKLAGYDLSLKLKDPFLKRAQELYSASFRNSPEYLEKQSNEVILTSIIPPVVDNYKSRDEYGHFTPNIRIIREYIEGVYPHLEAPMVSMLTKRVQQTLYSTKEIKP